MSIVGFVLSTNTIQSSRKERKKCAGFVSNMIAMKEVSSIPKNKCIKRLFGMDGLRNERIRNR